uniref:translation initiation factor IF-2-like n=1 Tax=Nyctereutes procyonoides TaxID=34880 RepID=UPI002444EA57|nr:translation initiation factor IF-2-like [Nyctereutes procyonoides]
MAAAGSAAPERRVRRGVGCRLLKPLRAGEAPPPPLRAGAREAEAAAARSRPRGRVAPLGPRSSGRTRTRAPTRRAPDAPRRGTSRRRWGLSEQAGREARAPQGLPGAAGAPGPRRNEDPETRRGHTAGSPGFPVGFCSAVRRTWALRRMLLPKEAAPGRRWRPSWPKRELRLGHRDPVSLLTKRLCF